MEANNYLPNRYVETAIDVRMETETVWMSANQMAVLFDCDYKTIRKHINNALKEE